MIVAAFAAAIAGTCWLLWANRVRQTGSFSLRADLEAAQRVTAHISEANISEALGMYAELTGRRYLGATNSAIADVNLLVRDQMAQWGWIRSPRKSSPMIQYHADGAKTVTEVKGELEAIFKRKGVIVVGEGKKAFKVLGK